jgi:hypothetical protein
MLLVEPELLSPHGLRLNLGLGGTPRHIPEAKNEWMALGSRGEGHFSLAQLFITGVGPSSSHPVCPMRMMVSADG